MRNLPRQCVGTNRQGERCGNAPIPGGTVCVLHGGAAPQARKAAERRRLAMVEPALEVIEACMQSGDLRLALKAAMALLDRVPGFGPNQTVTVESDTSEFRRSLEDMTPAQLQAKAEELVREIRESREPRLLPAHVIDVMAIPQDDNVMDISPNGIDKSDAK